MSRQRAERLLKSLGTQRNSESLRDTVRGEAGVFVAILDDPSRDLSERSLELWGSLVALGSLLEENDRGRRDGRDSLDLLAAESRAALATLIDIAGNLVRSFPGARALDDSAQSFARKAITQDVVLELIEQALKATLIDLRSAGLMQHVSRIASNTGAQAGKAESVSVKGTKNLIAVAALVGSMVGGVVGGVTGDVGGDISNHYELSEKAIGFIDAILELPVWQQFSESLPADERAVLRAHLEDMMRGRGPQ